MNQGGEPEIWCHQSRGRDSVERYMRRNGRLSVSRSPEGAIVWRVPGLSGDPGLPKATTRVG